MDFDGYIHGDSKRLFLNTELGCASACTYCYLPSEGYGIGLKSEQRSDRRTGVQVFDAVSTDPRIVKGKDGTVFSIGCFSECWDSKNRGDTRALIRLLLPYGNPIQLATKRLISSDALREFADKRTWPGQLSVFVSSATISRWSEFEPKTQAPNIRFRTLKQCGEAQVPAFLYLKPVISDVTRIDADKYGELMRECDVAAVIGDRFSATQGEAISPISQTLMVLHEPDVDYLRITLKHSGIVYANSVDTLPFLKELRYG